MMTPMSMQPINLIHMHGVQPIDLIGMQMSEQIDQLHAREGTLIKFHAQIHLVLSGTHCQPPHRARS